MGCINREFSKRRPKLESKAIGYQLRNHIPLAGPATREPCDGTEGRLRVSMGFTPRWYHDRLGVDFGQKWHLDPEYRYTSLVRMKELLHPSIPLRI